ncbi:glycoside hydrolase family 99-like domain-containing protein, partial [Alistipes ihumii]
MNRTLLTLAAAAAVLTGCRSERPVAGDDITVACYYFPNYHTGDPLNELNKGEGWSEWKLVREAQPRFEGHDQPKVPLWGYTDEKDPAVMARKIEAAASHGIDVMLFDWYRYDSVPFLNRCLDEGFLKAPNVNDIRFGLMWANHDWVEIHPATHGEPQKLLYPGKVSPEAFETIGDELVRDYFTRPNYWLIDGKAYFSVYDV